MILKNFWIIYTLKFKSRFICNVIGQCDIPKNKSFFFFFTATILPGK